MIAREIGPSIGGGSYQRNKGTAGGKVHAISAKKSLVKGVGGWRVGTGGGGGGERYRRGEKKKEAERI